MTREEIQNKIDDLTKKIENKEVKGYGVKKAKDEIESLEKELSELEDNATEEEVDDDPDTFFEAKSEPDDFLETIEEVKEEPKMVEDILVGKDVEVSEVKTEVKKVEPKKEVKVREEIELSNVKNVEELPDVAPKKDSNTKKYKFTYHTPDGNKITLTFRKGVKKLVRFGSIVELTADEFACYPRWFKKVD